jgi:hypothetical protein
MFQGNHWLKRVSNEQQQATGRAGCLLGILCYPEDERIWLLLKSLNFYRATRCHIPESSTLQTARRKGKVIPVLN